MKCLGNHRVFQQRFEGHHFERGLVRSFKHDWTRRAGLDYLKPATGADTPAVAGLETGKSILRHGRGEIVAKLRGGGKELLCDDAADGVQAKVLRTGVAAAVAKEAGYGVETTRLKRLAEYVLLRSDFRF